MGRPWPGVEILVLDEAGDPVPAGTDGVIWIKPPGAQRFTYRHDPEATARAWREDAFTVGDIGHLDPDGYLTITDRVSDMVLWGGVNIAPREIEEVLFEHPAVVDCAVFGVPDERDGERLKAVVELRGGATTEELADFVRARLADYKVPQDMGGRRRAAPRPQRQGASSACCARPTGPDRAEHGGGLLGPAAEDGLGAVPARCRCRCRSRCPTVAVGHQHPGHVLEEDARPAWPAASGPPPGAPGRSHRPGSCFGPASPRAPPRWRRRARRPTVWAVSSPRITSPSMRRTKSSTSSMDRSMSKTRPARSTASSWMTAVGRAAARPATMPRSSSTATSRSRLEGK